METGDRKRNKKEEKIRRKKLLRLFREEQLTKVWNKVCDDIGFCSEEDSAHYWDESDTLDPESDSALSGTDENYPNKFETMHNIFECD